jgi:hypothetical protein
VTQAGVVSAAKGRENASDSAFGSSFGMHQNPTDVRSPSGDLDNVAVHAIGEATSQALNACASLHRTVLPKRVSRVPCFPSNIRSGLASAPSTATSARASKLRFIKSTPRDRCRIIRVREELFAKRRFSVLVNRNIPSVALTAAVDAHASM